MISERNIKGLNLKSTNKKDITEACNWDIEEIRLLHRKIPVYSTEMFEKLRRR